MKSSIKKIISVLLAAALSACILSGCGETSGTSDSVSDATSINEVSSAEEVSHDEHDHAEESSSGRLEIPDKYKLKAPIGYTGTTKPEYFAEVRAFICDKYRISLDSEWVCNRAYDDYTGVYGYVSEAYNGAIIVNISDGPDLPVGDTPPQEYYKSQISGEMAEYTLREEVETTVNGVPTYCFWYEHPVQFTNMMYAFYLTDHYTYCLAGSFTESEAGYYSIQNAIATFETIDPQPEDQVVSE